MSQDKKKKVGRPLGSVKPESEKKAKIGGTVDRRIRVFVTAFCRKTSRSTSSILQEALEDFINKEKAAK